MGITYSSTCDNEQKKSPLIGEADMPKTKNGSFEEVMNTYVPSVNHLGGMPNDISQELSIFVNNTCSIDAVKNLKDGSNTCFTKSQLLHIVKEYNKKYPNDKIIGYSNATKNQLWNALNDRLNNQCSVEWCWLDQNFLNNNPSKHSLESQFKPRGPDGANDWLSTTNISNAMRMYEKLYRGTFKFFGPVPIDFDVMIKEIKNIDIIKLYNNGVRKIGFVFNLDPSHKSGSHWVAMYVDLEKGGVYYFDSYATSMGCPPDEIVALKDRLMSQITELFKLYGIRRKPVYAYNKTRFQRRNSECGVYSMYFILQMARGRSFIDVTNTIMMDEEIQQFRNVYFRPKYK